MKLAIFLLLILLTAFCLYAYVTSDRLNARCYKTNQDITTICVYSDGHSEIYREEVK